MAMSFELDDKMTLLTTATTLSRAAAPFAASRQLHAKAAARHASGRHCCYADGTDERRHPGP
jgi:hypothetical protein